MARILVLISTAFLALGASPASAAPPQNEYDLSIPSADGEGKSPRAHFGPATELEGPAVEESPGTAPTPASTPVQRPGKHRAKAGQSPQRSKADGEGAPERASSGRPLPLAQIEGGQAADGDSPPGGNAVALLLVGGLGLAGVLAVMWRLRRSKRVSEGSYPGS